MIMLINHFIEQQRRKKQNHKHQIADRHQLEVKELNLRTEAVHIHAKLNNLKGL